YDHIASYSCEPAILANPFGVHDLDELVNNIGDLHNEYLDYFLAESISENIHLGEVGFDAHFRSTTKTFFEGKGLYLTNDNYYHCIDEFAVINKSDITGLYSNFSIDAQNIISDLYSIMDINQSDSYSDIIDDLDNLYFESTE